MLGIPKDPEGQKKFVIGVAPLLLLFAYYQFWHTPKVASVIEDLTTRYEELDTKNQQAQSQASPVQVQRTQQQLALFEAHIKRLEELIPPREQEAQLLYDINARSRDAGVDLALLKPVTEEAGIFYTKRIYEARVIGPYHAIGRFIAQVGSLPRIVTISDLRITKQGAAARDSGMRLTADFKINTYIIPPPPSADTARAPGTTTTAPGGVAAPPKL